MSSWFSSSNASTGPNIAPVQLSFPQEAYYGPLVKEDTEWIQAGGFVTETQTFYATTTDGNFVMCQVIHSSVGVWYPSIQFTFRYVDQKNAKHVWKSTAVTNFVVGPNKLDKRSSKSDQFTITVDPSKPTVYTIEGKYDDETQISLTYEALTPGWKLGAGPRGGMTYFGALTPKPTQQQGTQPDISGGADGYCIHRFWPRCKINGILRLGKDVIQVEDARGTFIHAIQGMRPNVLASAWNFADFQSPATDKDGVSLLMMEFTSCPAYGSKKVNIGSVVVGDKLVSIVAGGAGVQGGSVAQHYETVKDVETEYDAPGAIKYTWEGLTLTGSDDQLKPVENGEKSSAEIDLKLLTSKPGEAYATQGLVEKVDVLGQIPYLVKKFVNFAAGTKPYIYTWLNQVEAKVVTPESGAKTVKGALYSEATFIS